jgi:CBS domain containing-hemolysin-like protein
VPRRGELIGHPAGFEFEVIDADPRRIKRLKIRGLPVFRETLDDVTGMIHIKDLLTRWGSEEPLDMQGLVREVLFVPPSMPVLDLLQQMQASHIHMAVVVDEYGGTDGLATIEDLVEEIVGEIEDEHDQAEAPQIVEAADGTLEVDARTPIEELENRIALDLLPEQQDEDIDTVGGLVFSVLGRVPRRGELIGHPAGFEFEVIDADPRRIKRLKIRGLPVDRRRPGGKPNRGPDRATEPAPRRAQRMAALSTCRCLRRRRGGGVAAH